MSQAFEDSPESAMPTEAQTPSVLFEINGENYTLTWQNTLVRRFLVGNGEYDHMLHTINKESGIFVFLKDLDGDELTQLLETNNFPLRIDPVLDQAAIDLYAQREAQGLDEAIESEFS